MSEFNRNMLPILGVNWFYFESRDRAMRLAKWAVAETRKARHPCSAEVNVCNDRPAHERYEVKISNW